MPFGVANAHCLKVFCLGLVLTHGTLLLQSKPRRMSGAVNATPGQEPQCIAIRRKQVCSTTEACTVPSLAHARAVLQRRRPAPEISDHKCPGTLATEGTYMPQQQQPSTFFLFHLFLPHTLTGTRTVTRSPFEGVWKFWRGHLFKSWYKPLEITDHKKCVLSTFKNLKPQTRARWGPLWGQG